MQASTIIFIHLEFEHFYLLTPLLFKKINKNMDQQYL